MTPTDKFVQINLWMDCPIGCDFCTVLGEPKTSDGEKILLINKAIDYIETNLRDNEYIEAFGLIGGELLFPRPSKEVEAHWFKLINTMNTIKNVRTFYLATSLMFPDVSFLLESINKLNRHTVICTSYDYRCRFNDKTADYYYNNVAYLTDKAVSINTTMIFTQWLVDYINSGKGGTSWFKNDSIGIIEPQLRRAELLAHHDDYHEALISSNKQYPNDFFISNRDSFISCVKKLIKDNAVKGLINFTDFSLRSNSIIDFGLGEKSKLLLNRWTGDNLLPRLSCGHMITGQFYLDSEACGFCDVERLLNEVGHG